MSRDQRLFAQIPGFALCIHHLTALIPRHERDPFGLVDTIGPGTICEHHEFHIFHSIVVHGVLAQIVRRYGEGFVGVFGEQQSQHLRFVVQAPVLERHGKH